jgi:cobalt-zinc-cadmium efflux system outer membrane protein
MNAPYVCSLSIPSMKLNTGLFFLLLMLFSINKGLGADSLRVSIRQADSIFIAHNFSLLAYSMNIDAQKAQIIQSKLYPNPLFTADFNAYDPQNNKAFHTGKTGQKSFQLEQLILLGGKRKSQIEIAKTNSRIAEIEFQEMVRQLKFQLHSSMYSLDEQTFLIAKYNNQLELLDRILAAYDVQAKKGNIPLKDVVRLKGVYLHLNNNRAEVYKLYFQEMAKVRTILQTDKIVLPVINDEDILKVIKPINLNELHEIAFQNRPDYLMSQQDVVLAEQYFSLQRKMALPDVSVFTSYDQRGGAFQDQINLGVSMPLPLWNRNKGNVNSAQYQIKQTMYSAEALKNQIRSEVQNYHALYNQTIKEYQRTRLLYNEDFEITLKGMSDNFQKGNVSLIEFVDFFEGYNNSLAEIARIKIQLAISSEQLSLSTGKEIF